MTGLQSSATVVTLCCSTGLKVKIVKRWVENFSDFGCVEIFKLATFIYFTFKFDLICFNGVLAKFVIVYLMSCDSLSFLCFVMIGGLDSIV